jgi:branched-chain amino acid transport system ATP-binding protein
VSFRRARHHAGPTPDIACAGIAYVPENMGIFSDLTVRENLLAARSARRRDGRGPPGMDLRLLRALKKFWNQPAGTLVRRPEADGRDRPRHRRAAQADC